jgi:hypothetical protein
MIYKLLLSGKWPNGQPNSILCSYNRDQFTSDHRKKDNNVALARRCVTKDDNYRDLGLQLMTS